MVLIYVVLLAAAAAGQSPDSAAAESQQAKRMLNEGRFTEAIPIYQKLVAAMPGNPGLRLNLGIAQHMAGRDREAAATLGEVLRVNPNHGPALAMSGASYLRLGEPLKAVGFLERAARLMSEDAEVLHMLVDAGRFSGKHATAAGALRTLARLQPGEPQIWANLGKEYEALSEEAFAKLDTTAAGSAYGLALAAETRATQRQFRTAGDLYREALAKVNRRDWREEMAATYEQAGQRDLAAAERAKAARIPAPACAQPTAECHYLAKRYLQSAQAPGQSAEVLYWRSKSYNALAREAFAQLSRFPESAEWHAFLGNLYRNQNKPVESVKEWQTAIAKRPEDLDLSRELAATLLSARQFAQAESILRELAGKAPQSAEIQWMLGESLTAQRKLDEAIAPLERAVKLDPALLPAQASLGRALLSANRAKDATPHLRAALPLDRDGSMHFQLSRALAAQGETAEAARLAQKSQLMRRTAGSEGQADEATPR